MLEQIATALFPSEALSPQGRRLRTFAVLLFPAALVAGLVLQVANRPPRAVETTINIDGATRLARKFAEKLGVPAATWPSTLKYTSETPASCL